MSFDYLALCGSDATEANRHLGVRFDAKGRFLREPGNTVVRHVIPGSPTEAALTRLRVRMMNLPWAHGFAWTDIDSYHMTVFGCAIETGREEAFWPAALPLDAPIDRTTAWMDARLAAFEGPGPFTMALDEVTPFGLTVTGTSEADEAMARRWRDELAIAFDRRSPGHEHYRFHITMAYIKDWMPNAMAEPYREAMRDMTVGLKQELSALALGPPVFCTFDDMNWFEPVRTLPGTGLPEAVGRRGVQAPPASV
jgi:hypothetical protein